MLYAVEEMASGLGADAHNPLPISEIHSVGVRLMGTYKTAVPVDKMPLSISSVERWIVFCPLAPLLEKEGNASRGALVPQRSSPVRMHRTRPRPALAANNH